MHFHRQPPVASCTYLLSQAENLEALEVGQVLPPVGALRLLSVVALSPFAIDLVLFPQLLHGASAGSAGELRDDEMSEGSVVEREDVTGDDLLLFGGRTVNQDLFDLRFQSEYIPANLFAQFLSSLFSFLFFFFLFFLLGPDSWNQRTRRWSIISTTAANFPV